MERPQARDRSLEVQFPGAAESLKTGTPATLMSVVYINKQCRCLIQIESKFLVNLDSRRTVL